MKRFITFVLAATVCVCVNAAWAQTPRTTKQTTAAKGKTDAEIAARFAPVFYQALGDKPRSDYITNFDFDGDWSGDNNWENAGDKKFPLRGFIYYSVSETRSHYFIHYAVFHPRHYKGGEKAGLILSEIIREGAKRAGDNDPTGLLDEATVAHENDMEGALVVAVKNLDGPTHPRVVFVETLRHNAFNLYVADQGMDEGFDRVRVDDGRPVLYVEPKGHGIAAYDGDEMKGGNKRFLVYKYMGRADDPDAKGDGPVGYQLVPIETTLWTKARTGTKIAGKTFGAAHDYADLSIGLVRADGSVETKKIKLGGLGSAFLGNSGGINMARPPWGWFDSKRRDDKLGLWFFDPATIVKRDFSLGETFPTAYVRLPFWAGKP